MDVRLIAWLISEVGFPVVVSLALLRLVFFEAAQLRRELRLQRTAIAAVGYELSLIKGQLARLFPHQEAIERSQHAA